jgi:hypothetical protein
VSWSGSPLKRLQQPVQALAGQLAGLHQRHRQRVHPRRQAEVVEAAARHHPAADHGGGVGHGGQRLPDVLVQPAEGPRELRQDLRGHPERHRGLMPPPLRDRTRAGPIHRGAGPLQRPAHAGQDGVQDRVAGQLADGLVVGVQRRPQRVDGGGRGGQELAGEPLTGPQPGERHGGGHRRAGQQRDTLLGPQLVGQGTPGGQRRPGVVRLAVRPQHLADPDQGLEGVRQRDHLAGAADRPARHRPG